ncbi:hypothetical protein EVAR_87500_1 [Eumeta japonica]|uniref:Uncharacterized protein n=1 Tax=Eumeta variegata TaxID=151549 RepID=A0A4C1VXR6_EUMVA|nr:hypothetical protein EVAR_87500_1 [Eumeta japonica]
MRNLTGNEIEIARDESKGKNENRYWRGFEAENGIKNVIDHGTKIEIKTATGIEYKDIKIDSGTGIKSAIRIRTYLNRNWIYVPGLLVGWACLECPCVRTDPLQACKRQDVLWCENLLRPFITVFYGLSFVQNGTGPVAKSKSKARKRDEQQNRPKPQSRTVKIEYGIRIDWRGRSMWKVASLTILVLNIMGLVYINMKQQLQDFNSTHHDPNNHMLSDLLQINHDSLKVVFGILVCMCIAGILSSVLLVWGLKKNRPSFVLFFFVFGIFLVILLLLGALLEFLHNFLILASIQIVIAMVYIHFVIVVHTVYELMQRGKLFGANEHIILEEEIQDL